jgi:hypothetical protein
MWTAELENKDDISRSSVILYGEDPFAELSIPRDAEIRQLRQQWSLN